MSQPPVLPWECRDKEDQARECYEQPLRRSNQVLTEENLRLKRILRQNGISWSPLATVYLANVSPSRRKTRSSLPGSASKYPTLPVEVLLRILYFAMRSPCSIIDPLSPLDQENITNVEKNRGNQIAVHFLATCKAMHTEGTQYLWKFNHFVFTSPQALLNLSELSSVFRNNISHITMRVIARYYDDQRRKHKLERGYHADIKKDHLLKVHVRPKESPLVRGGFRCYTWSQVVDFLSALRPPYDPNLRDRNSPRPRLLPALTSLRIDLVNFSDALVPFSGSELHNVSSHELGCTLNELQISGMPFDDAGMKASAELSGLLKDEGLYLDGPASFMDLKKGLQPLSGSKWCARVIRAWNGTDDDGDSVFEGHDEGHGSHEGWHRPKLGLLPPAPQENKHPPSTRAEHRVIWKQVPIARDASKRNWVEFSRSNGYEIDGFDSESDGAICPCCGEPHPEPSFVEYLMSDAM